MKEPSIIVPVIVVTADPNRQHGVGNGTGLDLELIPSK